MPTNDGSLIVSLCYMQGNEPSPKCQTDLLLISPRESKGAAAFDHSDKSMIDLLSESIQIRAKAHREILRQGGDLLAEAATAFVAVEPDSPAFSSLIFLAAAHGDDASIGRITSLAQGEGRVASLAWRAAAAWPEKFPGLSDEVINAAAVKTEDPKLLVGLLEFLHATKRPISNAVSVLAAHDDPFVRQFAAILLARQASDDELAALAEGTTDQRRAATLATVFKLWQRAESVIQLPKGGTVAVEKMMKLNHPEGPIDLRDLGAPIGIYRMSDWWQDTEIRESSRGEFDRLQKALEDPDKVVTITAATGLFFLKDDQADAKVITVLGNSETALSMAAGQATKAELKKALLALKGATFSTDTEIPEAFREIDWDAATAPKGDPANGKVLFTQRGCVACHLAPDTGAGGSIGPTMVAVGDRFPPSYLAASILVPNLTVSPNFHPNTITMKDGGAHTGFVAPGAEDGIVNLRGITGLTTKLDKSQIAKQEASEQSMMPAGLVQTPAEMADLIAYMVTKPGKKKGKGKKGTAAAPQPATPVVLLDALSDWETGGNWQVDDEGVFVLTPREGEVDWKRYGHYLWSKQTYRDFVIDFEYKHEAGGNSGLYFNVTDRENAVGSVIEVQIRDSANAEKITAHAVTGGILPKVDPKANAAKPSGEWNHMRVRSVEGVVTVTLNGELVNRAELTHPKLKGKPKEGYIGFQDHGLPFRLRNIRIRDLSAAPGEQAARLRLVELVSNYSEIPPLPPESIAAELKSLPDVESKIWDLIESSPRDHADLEVVVAGGVTALLELGLATDLSLTKARKQLMKARAQFASFKDPLEFPGYVRFLDGEISDIPPAAVEMIYRDQVIHSMVFFLGRSGDSSDLELIRFFLKPEHSFAILADEATTLLDGKTPDAPRSAVTVQRRIVSTQPNAFQFPPTEAKFVRVEVLGSNKGQPCIDELEIFSGDSPTNLALQSNGAKATASSLLKGHAEKHRIEFLNDGQYGNARSWIPAAKTGWAQIELPEILSIDRVVLSRDRGGQVTGRTPTSIDILVSKDGEEWQTVKKVRPPGQNTGLKEQDSGDEAEAKPKPTAARGNPNPDHPNIVLILADDFGWGDTSCNNPDSPIQTPQIDRIAAEGIRFTNAHTPSAVCTPTRYGLLTGRYPWRSYLKSEVLAYYAPALIPEGRTTVASYLRSQGYRTGGFGKWHLGLGWTPVAGDPTNWRSHWKTRDPKIGAKLSKGIDHTKPFKNAPTDIGFDTYFGTPSNAGRVPFFIHNNRVFGNPERDKQGMMRDPNLSKDTVDDIYVDKAIAFIESNEKNYPENPFFIYLPLNAIHGAVKVPARFEGKTGMTKREDKILWADQNVGRMLDALDQMKLTDDTLVIFTTDNGPLNSPTARKNGHEPTGPYRGFKTGAWDGGTRVPFAARWPNRIPAGATSDHLIGLVDMLATFAEMCGEPLPEGAGPDSVSQLAAILQDKENITPRPALVTATYRGLLALRQGEWKAIFGTKWSGGHTSPNYGGLGPDKTMDDPQSGQLYNLETDPEEQNDLWESNPEVVERLRGELERIKQLDQSDEPPTAESPTNAEVRPADPSSPNVILILSDDMGYSDLQSLERRRSRLRISIALR